MPMWPWEHVIVGYVVYSILTHLVYRDGPGGMETLAVVVGSVLPDLIDKPLAWHFGIFDAGHALGHSIFFAIPLAIAAGLLARRVGHTRTGIAFGLAYLLHLPADIVDGYFRGGAWHTHIVLWPVERRASSQPDRGFVAEFYHQLSGYQAELTTSEPSTYIQLQLGLLVLAVILWLYDGAPILSDLLRAGRRARRRMRNRASQ